MSYPERDNPHKRSWNSPNAGMSPGIIKMFADISANSVTSFKERKEASTKFTKALEEATEREKNLRLTQPSFSAEQRSALAKTDYVIYRLRGVNMGNVIERYMPNWPWKDTKLKDEVSLLTEVAIIPYSTGLIGTSGKTYDKQKSDFDKFKDRISKQIPGVTAKLGKLVDYIDIEMAHRSRYGRGILDRYYSGGVRTLSKVKGEYYAVANTSFSNTLEINLSLLKKTESAQFVEIAPLIVPVGINWKPNK